MHSKREFLNSCFSRLSIPACSVVNRRIVVIHISPAFGIMWWNLNGNFSTGRGLNVGWLDWFNWIFVLIEKWLQRLWLTSAARSVSQASKAMDRPLIFQIFQRWLKCSNDTKLKHRILFVLVAVFLNSFVIFDV